MSNIMPTCFVRTRYLPATDFHGSRILATMVGDRKTRVTVPWHTGLGLQENHERAASALLERSNPDWALSSVCSEDGGGYVFGCRLSNVAGMPCTNLEGLSETDLERHAESCERISRIARLILSARKCRFYGDIREAVRAEKLIDAEYEKLPASLRW